MRGAIKYPRPAADRATGQNAVLKNLRVTLACGQVANPLGPNRRLNAQVENHNSPQGGFDWWTPEFQRAIDIIADSIYHDMKIQIMGQAGCGYHPPTSDPDELERFAREVGLDASYSIVTANGRVSWPVLIDLSSNNGDDNPPKRAPQARLACPIPVTEGTT